MYSVLYPTLTSEGFTTEVYHQNGKGEDAGVVYSEMQGRENNSGDLMAHVYVSHGMHVGKDTTLTPPFYFIKACGVNFIRTTVPTEVRPVD